MTLPGPNTLAGIRAAVTRYHKENESVDLLNDAINDAIESLWRSIVLVSLSQFLGGPIQNLNIAAGSERGTIVAIPDPTQPLVPAALVDGQLPQRTLNFFYTLVTESGSETNLSPAANIVIPLNSIASVPPPAYAAGAIGWNCYANLNDGRTALQNAVPLSFTQPFQEPDDTGVSDAPNLPSPPASNTTADNIFYIRLIQVQNPDSTWTTWQAGNLDDHLMLRASRAIASTSTFQGYAYDVVNGSTVEIRPAAGTSLNPRYFFVVKPRRLRYDNAPIPFTNIAATEFLKMYADAAIDLSNHEYTGYQVKQKKADAIRQEILLGLNTQATTKQKTITPYLGW